MKILVAQDVAFNFTYRANLDALRRIGDVSFFSPLEDTRLPSCDLLYLPGGYPELFARQLQDNASMRHQIREYAEQDGALFAECGGFMYLCQDIDGTEMCGVLPLQVTMQDARLHLGYRQMSWQGQTFRGHEFHYSTVVNDSDLPPTVHIHRMQTTATGRSVDTPIYQYRHVLAGYTHWYWADRDQSIFFHSLVSKKGPM